MLEKHTNDLVEIGVGILLLATLALAGWHFLDAHKVSIGPQTLSSLLLFAKGYVTLFAHDLSFSKIFVIVGAIVAISIGIRLLVLLGISVKQISRRLIACVMECLNLTKLETIPGSIDNAHEVTDAIPEGRVPLGRFSEKDYPILGFILRDQLRLFNTFLSRLVLTYGPMLPSAKMTIGFLIILILCMQDFRLLTALNLNPTFLDVINSVQHAVLWPLIFYAIFYCVLSAISVALVYVASLDTGATYRAATDGTDFQTLDQPEQFARRLKSMSGAWIGRPMVVVHDHLGTDGSVGDRGATAAWSGVMLFEGPAIERQTMIGRTPSVLVGVFGLLTCISIIGYALPLLDMIYMSVTRTHVVALPSIAADAAAEIMYYIIFRLVTRFAIKLYTDAEMVADYKSYRSELILISLKANVGKFETKIGASKTDFFYSAINQTISQVFIEFYVTEAITGAEKVGQPRAVFRFEPAEQSDAIIARVMAAATAISQTKVKHPEFDFADASAREIADVNIQIEQAKRKLAERLPLEIRQRDGIERLPRSR